VEGFGFRRVQQKSQKSPWTGAFLFWQSHLEAISPPSGCLPNHESHQFRINDRSRFGLDRTAGRHSGTTQDGWVVVA
jgi:hypothetical protein